MDSNDNLTWLNFSFIVSFPVLAEWSGSGNLAVFTNYSLFLAYPLGNLTRTVSIYMTVAVSAHRFIGVCFPFKAHEICTRGHVRSLITSIFIFGALYNIPKFLELELNSCYSEQYSSVIPKIDASDLRLTPTYILGYLGWSNTFTLLIVPFSLLISMNIRVIREVQMMRKRHTSLCASVVGANEQMRIESAKERSTTIMLIGIVIVFLSCNTLALVSNVLETILNYSQPEMRDWLQVPYRIICDISNFLVMIGMSINMLVYATFSDKYRILLKFFLSSASSLRKRNYLLDELSEAQSVWDW